jgi:hypothetical protein
MAVIHPAANEDQRAAFASFLEDLGLAVDDLEPEGRHSVRCDMSPADVLALQRAAARIGTTVSCLIRGLTRSFLRRGASV